VTRRAAVPSAAANEPDEQASDPSAVIVGGHPLSRFYLRFHVSLILLFSFSAGVLASKAMLLAGMYPMLWRFPLALVVSYAAFFAGVRVWLAYVGANPFSSPRSGIGDNGSGGSFDIGSWGGSGSSSSPSLKGGGGDFSGGGASGSFGDAAPSANLESGSNIGALARMPAQSGGWFSSASNSGARSGGWFSSGSGGGSGSGGKGLDIDLGGDGDGWMVALLLVLVAALLTSVFGAVIYLLHAAPVMLADVAFQAMLAGGLVKSSKRWRDASWERSLLHSTWIPFALVFLLALGTAYLAGRLFPGAHTLHEVIQAAWGTLG